jgi:hypothetical protein
VIITPTVTADYGARYLLASIPAFCIAGAIEIRNITDWNRRAASVTAL